MISFSNSKNDGNVKSFEGQEYIVTEDIDTDEKYKDSEAQFHSLYNHWSLTGAYIDMKEFLNNEKRLIMQEKKEKMNKAPRSRTSLFLHDLPLQGNFIWSLPMEKANDFRVAQAHISNQVKNLDSDAKNIFKQPYLGKSCSSSAEHLKSFLIEK